MEKGLLIKDLEVGKIYFCLLSERRVLITTKFPSHHNGTEYWNANATCYNKMSGYYSDASVVDHQLSEIK